MFILFPNFPPFIQESGKMALKRIVIILMLNMWLHVCPKKALKKHFLIKALHRQSVCFLQA